MGNQTNKLVCRPVLRDQYKISEINRDLWLGSVAFQILKIWVEINELYFQSENAFDIIARQERLALYESGLVWSQWPNGGGLWVEPCLPLSLCEGLSTRGNQMQPLTGKERPSHSLSPPCWLCSKLNHGTTGTVCPQSSSLILAHSLSCRAELSLKLLVPA